MNASMSSFTYGGSLLQSSYADRARKPASVMLVPMIDIFTVLVTFLLMTAVFSRLTILQLELPSSTETSAGPPPEFRLEVIVRKEGFELTNGNELIATLPKTNDAYDFKKLTELAVALKKQYPKAEDASVLLERDIEYDYLVQAMDAIRTAYVPREETGESNGTTDATQPQPLVKMGLFAHIAVGEAPESH